MNHRRKLKEKLVKYKGGECEICGYDRRIKAMDFHHKNPNEKEFELTAMNRKWETLKKKRINVFWFVQIVTVKFMLTILRYKI